MGALTSGELGDCGIGTNEEPPIVARLLGVRPDRPSAFSGTFSESIRTFSNDAARLKR